MGARAALWTGVGNAVERALVASDERLVNEDGGIDTRQRELRRAIAGRDGKDGDEAPFDSEANAPVFDREPKRVALALDATIRMRLWAELERPRDGLREVHIVLACQPSCLLRGQLGPCHVKARLGILGQGVTGQIVHERSEPARARRRNGIRIRDIGLDIEHRRSVEHIDIADMQHEPFHRLELDDTEADRIRTMRRSCREHAPPSLAARRQHLRAPAFVEVKPKDDEEVFPALEILERVLVIAPGKQLDRAGDAFGGGRLPGSADPVAKGRADDANRLECQGTHRRAGVVDRRPTVRKMGDVKIGTWNVNGIRARQEQVKAWIDQDQPDVVCLQELKATQAQIPAALCNLEGYACYWHGAGPYSGVALHVRRDAFTDVPDLTHPHFDFETRIVTAKLGKVMFASVYVPNGGKDYAAKLHFFEAMEAWVRDVHASGLELVLAGDMNVTRTDMDVHPKERKAGAIGQRPDERALFERLLGAGLIDVGRALAPDDDGLFTWWAPWRNMRQRNIGWRIDYILASPAIANTAKSCVVLRELGTSDHAPVLATFEYA